MSNLMPNEMAGKVFKVIVLYGTTLIAYPVAFMITTVVMSPSLGGYGQGPSPEVPFFLSHSAICLMNVLLYRNIFGKGKVIKSILLNVPVIAFCILLSKLDIPIFTIYYTL